MGIEFSDTEKIECFDRISELFYHKNFGSASKSDIELLMFDFLMNHFINQFAIDGVLDYEKCSDYEMSNLLGITQQRIRNLKIKKQLKYPDSKFNWKESFRKLLVNARYDKSVKKVIVSIPDPNLFIEIENFIEQEGGYVDIQLNRKILQLKPEYYFALALMYEDRTTKEQFIKEISKNLNKQNKNDYSKYLDSKHCLELAKDMTGLAANIGTVVGSIATAGPLLMTAAKYLY